MLFHLPPPPKKNLEEIDMPWEEFLKLTPVCVFCFPQRQGPLSPQAFQGVLSIHGRLKYFMNEVYKFVSLETIPHSLGQGIFHAHIKINDHHE